MNMHYRYLKRNIYLKMTFFLKKPELKLLSFVFDVEGGDNLSISCRIFGICCVDVND
jgi:hypothetical protein